MARKKLTDKTASVRVFERVLKSGNISFCIIRMIDKEGKRTQEWERLPNSALGIDSPITTREREKKMPRYKEARRKADQLALTRQEEIRAYSGIDGNHFAVGRKILLSEWMKHCADDRANRSQAHNRSTWAKKIEYTAKAIQQFCNGRDVVLSDINEDFVRGFIRYLQTDYVTRFGIAPAASTAQKCYAAFHLCLKEAKRQKYIQANPCELIAKEDKIKVPKSTREALTEEDLRRLAGTPIASEATRCAFLFSCFCGMRISDIEALRWGNIVVDNGKWTAKIRMQKTGEPIDLPLSDKARQFVPEKGEKGADDKVFSNLPSQQTMNKQLKAWAAAAGIGKNVSLHIGRHTAATLLITMGAKVYDVQKILGHSDIRTTQIYAEMVDERKRKAMDLLNSIDIK